MSTNGRQHSRFSTLKVFKLGAGSGAGSSSGKPPPPPPKDEYYLQPDNRSFVSLAPSDVSAAPSSFNTPIYNAYNNHPNNPTSGTSLNPTSAYSRSQTPSLPGTPAPRSPPYGFVQVDAPSLTNLSNGSTPRLPSGGSSNGLLTPDAAPRKSPFAKLMFGRSKSPKPPKPELPAPPPQQDEGISMPWNFQHNVHVDEAFGGLPPSWTASLAQAGFTDDEIAAILQQRLRARSPQTLASASTASLSNHVDLELPNPYAPQQPILGTGTIPRAAGVGIVPRPRMSSLPRSDSQYSLASSSASASRRRPAAAQRKYSNASSSSSFTSDEPLPSSTSPAPQITLQHSISTTSSSQRSLSSSPVIPATAPAPLTIADSTPLQPRSRPTRQRTREQPELVVVNNPVTPFTPPPAYASSDRSMVPLPEKEKAGFGGMDSGQFGTTTPNKDPPPQPPRLQEQDQVTSLASASASISSPASTTSSPGRPSDSASNNASFASASTSTFTAASLTSPPRRKRMSFAPPRLSLDAPLGDLTSWTEELFSSIPSAREDGAGGGKPWESKGRRDSAVLPSAGSGGSSSASAKGSPASASVVPKGYPPRGSSLRRKPQQEVAEEPAVRPHEREREREMTDGSTVSDYSRRSDTDPSLDLSEFPSPPSYSSFAPIGAQTASPPSTAAPNVTSPKTKHKPVPLTSLGRPSSRSSIAEEGDAAPPATTPLWNELLGMVRQDSPGVASVLVRSPALDEGEEGSPVIPATLSSPDRRKLMERLAREAIAGRSPLSAGMTVPNRREEEEDEDDEFLLPGVTRRGDNRDSNLTVRPERDSASTLRDVDRSSAEGASIVRGAVVAYATKANVIGAGVRSRSGSAGTSPVEKRDVGRNEAGADLQPRTDLRQDRGLSLLLEGVHQTIEGVDEDEEPEDEGSGSGSASRSGSGSAESGWTSLTGSSRRQTVATSVSSEGASDAPKTPKTPSLAYLQATPSPSPSATQSFFELDQDEPEEASDSASDDDGEREEKESQETETVHIRSQSTSPLSAAAQKRNQRPRIVISGIPPEANSATTSAGKSPVTSPAHSKNPSSPSSLSPATPAVRYRGWLAEVLAPLDDFINDALDPRERYVDLREIAEGESGSVYAARVVPLPDLSSAASHTPSAKAWARAAAKDSSPSSNKQTVAIKNVQVSPTGSPKIGELKHELSLMRGLSHPNILTMDGLYMDLVEDSLWIRMELMERSLADVIGLVEEGLEITEVIVARFASDILSGLSYLQTHGIAHRDVRSDNMLLNCEGVLKLADFSNGVRVTAESPTCSDVVGVVYWQAPEVRSGSYDALKVDVWSLGATIWETLQTVPPFSDVQDASQIGRQWPPLDDPDAYSRSLHDFLARCSMPAASRPTPKELLATPFIRSACRHSVIAQLLSDCTNIETRLNRRQSGESMDSQGTVS